jgi:TPR repeat protein
MTRFVPLLILMSALLASCGPAADKPDAQAEAEAAKADPEAGKAAADKQKQAEQKAAFEAAGGDEAKVDDLADAGNGFALYHRGKGRIASTDYVFQQGGFEDMEKAAEGGNADAQLWLGEKMAYGLMGYPLKPNSGLMMMEKAAKQDNIDAILAVGLMYEQDTFMRDMDKAKTWYERGVELGSEKAKDALAKLGTPQDF